MFPVIINSENKEHDFDSFNSRFIEICKSMQDQNRALAFAFILYDFENAHITKVLKDQDYWLSLNSVSGKYLTVFSFHFKPKSNVIYDPEIKYGNHSVLNEMASVYNTQNPSESSNILIEKYFGNIAVVYPAVLFFQVSNDKVLDSVLIQLDSEQIEASFNELKIYISQAVIALKQISDENKQNYTEIFNLVKSNVKNARIKIKTKKVIKSISSVTELGSTIVGLGN